MRGPGRGCSHLRRCQRERRRCSGSSGRLLGMEEFYRVRWGVQFPPCVSASIGIKAGEVLQEVACLITTHAGDHLSGDGLPGVNVCQFVDGALCLVCGEAGGGDRGGVHRVRCL